MESVEAYARSLPKVVPGNTVPANIASKQRAAAKRRRAPKAERSGAGK
jgi:hypothetical protein